jgi:two-component system response regulator AtoC
MGDKPVVMIVDDDGAMRTFLQAFLAERGYGSMAWSNAEDAVREYQVSRPSAVVLDLMMPGGMDGLQALAAFKRIDHEVPIIVVSSLSRTTTVVQAMKLGAADFVLKPFTDEELALPLRNALKRHELSLELASVRGQLQHQSRYVMLGVSHKMSEVRELIERVADTDATVLIEGESGTGKELVARALHARSPRAEMPFVKVNCAALPTELLESELFGFERGAFTGAIQHKAGKFEFANHGTMFLDEISEMSAPLQAKLLQVLQDGEFARLGGKADVHVDVRVIAATNRDLDQAVEEGHFRKDLFFRLNVVTILLPPLRDRREEIPDLVDHFLKKYSVQYNRARPDIPVQTLRLLMDYDWPGNIRELENVIKRLVILGGDFPIRKELARTAAIPLSRSPASGTARVPADRPGATPPPAAAAAPPVAAAPAALEPGTYSLKDIARTAARQAECELIARMLHHTRWNRKETAEILGISYKALLYKIKENGLDKVPSTP